MKKIAPAFIFIVLLLQTACAQPKTLEEKVESLLSFSVPTITAEELRAELDEGKNLIILDTRQSKEYEVSHLRNASFVDYDDYDKKQFQTLNPEDEIIVYCSIGYRSEKVAEKLEKWGFKNVRNLYGGIFEWKNKGNEVIDEAGNSTERVHTYNKKWSQWLTAGEKVYE